MSISFRDNIWFKFLHLFSQVLVLIRARRVHLEEYSTIEGFNWKLASVEIFSWINDVNKHGYTISLIKLYGKHNGSQVKGVLWHGHASWSEQLKNKVTYMLGAPTQTAPPSLMVRPFQKERLTNRQPTSFSFSIDILLFYFTVFFLS